MENNITEIEQAKKYNIFNNKKIIAVFITSLTLLIAAIVIITVFWSSKNNYNNYSKDISALTEEIDSIKEKIEPSNLENLKINNADEYFTGLEEAFSFEGKLDLINNNAKYKKISSKVSKYDLGIDEAVRLVQDLQKDNENIRIILQKNGDIDSDINTLGEYVPKEPIEYMYYDNGYYEYTEKLNKITEKIEKLKYDTLGLSVNNNYKKIKDSFIEALNHRLKYIEFKKKICEAKSNALSLKSTINYCSENAENERAKALKSLLSKEANWAANSEMEANKNMILLDEKNKEITVLISQADYENSKYNQLLTGGEEPVVPASAEPAIKSSEEIKIIEFYNNYAKAMVSAINSNDFSIVETYLKKDSNLYNSQIDLIKSLNEQTTKEEFLGCTLSDITPNKNGYSFKVNERYKIIKEGTIENKEQSFKYTLVNSNGYKLTDVKSL